MSRGARVSVRKAGEESEIFELEIPPDSVRRAVGIKLAIIARQLRHRFDERIDKMGMTRAKWILIAAAARLPGATQRMIASQLEVTDVTAGRLIDRVCADGLLERRENPLDRRAYCVHLTPAAQPILEQLAEAAEGFETETFADIDEDDLVRLDELLAKIARNLGATRRDSGGSIVSPKDA